MGNQNLEFGQLLPPPQKTEGQSLSERTSALSEIGQAYSEHPEFFTVSVALISAMLAQSIVPDRISSRAFAKAETDNKPSLTQSHPELRRGEVTDAQFSWAGTKNVKDGEINVAYKYKGQWLIGKTIEQDGTLILVREQPFATGYLTPSKMLSDNGNLTIVDQGGSGFIIPYGKEAIKIPETTLDALGSVVSAATVAGKDYVLIGGQVVLKVNYNDPSIFELTSIEPSNFSRLTSDAITSVDNPNEIIFANFNGTSYYNFETNEYRFQPWGPALQGKNIYNPSVGHLKGYNGELHNAAITSETTGGTTVLEIDGGEIVIPREQIKGSRYQFVFDTGNNQVVSLDPTDIQIHSISQDQQGNWNTALDITILFPWDELTSVYQEKSIINVDDNSVSVLVTDSKDANNSGVWIWDKNLKAWTKVPLVNFETSIAGVTSQKTAQTVEKQQKELIKAKDKAFTKSHTPLNTLVRDFLWKGK